MLITPVLLGFFTAIGWWGGNKVTGAVDAMQKPPACEVKHEGK